MVNWALCLRLQPSQFRARENCSHYRVLHRPHTDFHDVSWSPPFTRSYRRHIWHWDSPLEAGETVAILSSLGALE
jgi:hypothetical protein